MRQPTPGRRRRVHSAKFKAQAVQASQQPGVSMSAIVIAHGINANLLQRWVHEMAHPPIDSVTESANPVGFIALPMPAPSAPPAPSGELIRIEVRRGSATIALTWPTTAADACAAWMRELLR